MKIGYYPGCSMEGTGIEYGESLHAVSKAFGIELEEINEWNCCGATAAHNMNKALAISLPARVLALGEKQGFTEIFAPCAACYSRLLSAWHEMKEDDELRKKIEKIIELPINCSAKPIGILDFYAKFITPEMKKTELKPFQRKVACYYGCLLTRPKKLVNFERFEDPLVMEEILKLTGAEPIDWAFKTECCGAGLSVSRTDVVAKLSGKIIEDAMSRGAEAIIVACPMCQSNLDMRRPEIDKYLNQKTDIPIMFITQAIGLSLGMSEESLGLKRHFVPVEPMLRSPIKIKESKQKVKEGV